MLKWEFLSNVSFPWSLSAPKTRSRRIRNPRFAPEALERRLSPSTLALDVPVPAEVSPFVPPTELEDIPFPLPPNYPPLDPTLPPLEDPQPPVEPVLPG